MEKEILFPNIYSITILYFYNNVKIKWHKIKKKILIQYKHNLEVILNCLDGHLLVSAHDKIHSSEDPHIYQISQRRKQ